jgi:putative RecB family exonuclease
MGKDDGRSAVVVVPPAYPLLMALELPVSLSPSKVASFKDCALAFRFSAIDRLPEPASPWTVKGSLVHRALELLLAEEPRGRRSIDAAMARLDRAMAELQTNDEYRSLGLEVDEEREFVEHAGALVHRYFDLEDPNEVHDIGLELRLEVQLGSLTMRGIIDRLEIGPDGEWVVTDYKTGRAPRVQHESARLGGVHFYAFLLERLFGRRPARIQLLYLGEPVAIVAEPSDQSVRGLEQRAQAIWSAVERACEQEDFRPRPSGLCDYCSFRTWCPAFGGDPTQAAVALRGPVVTAA